MEFDSLNEHAQSNTRVSISRVNNNVIKKERKTDRKTERHKSRKRERETYKILVPARVVHDGLDFELCLGHFFKVGHVFGALDRRHKGRLGPLAFQGLPIKATEPGATKMGGKVHRW